MQLHLRALAGVCLLGLIALPGRSEILVAKTRTSPWIFGGGSYSVGFNDASDTTFSFNTTQANTRIVITFNAECAVKGTAFNWVDIDLVVDPAGPTGETVASPSNSDNAFCSGNDTPSDFLTDSGDGWVSASTQATMVLPQAGTHTVKVRLNGQQTGGISRLDDMSLIVLK